MGVGGCFGVLIGFIIFWVVSGIKFVVWWIFLFEDLVVIFF